MEYQVSDRIEQAFQQLTAMPQVQEALQSIQADHAASIDEQIEFALIEAPTFHEEARAQRLKSKLTELGVEDVSIDENRNVVGRIRGSQAGEALVEAHMDTVFPFGTTTGVRREGDMLYAPGIYDNARGIACMLAALRALRRAGIQTRKSLLVAGTTREEATGALGGMRDILQKHAGIDASISVDGGFMECLTFNATYNSAVEYTFTGVGGHAFSAFGKVANPLGAACRAVTRMHGIEVQQTPKTTYAAAKMISSEHSGITAIPDSCRLYVNYRSDDAQAFDRLEREIDLCMQSGCDEENARWNADCITVKKKMLSTLPGGRQDAHIPLVEANYICADYVGANPELRSSGNSNSNIPISLGLPAVTVGSSRSNCHAHSLEECFCTRDAYKCPQGLFLLLLMVLGVEGGIPSCL